MASEENDLRASDLLPPDDPRPDDRPKKIAERRVVGWFMADRLVSRLERRPVGNSKTFWSRIEEDDPFIPRPTVRRLRQDHTLYPADRIDRIPESQRPPPPRPQRPAEPPPPKPPQPKRPMKAELNPDPRAVPAPKTRPEPPPPPPEPIDRTPPAPSPPKKSRTGRIRVSSAKERPHGGTGMLRDTRPAAEVRAEKSAARQEAEPKAPPKLRKLDDVLGILGQLKAAQELHSKGLLDEDAVGADVVDDAPRPMPKRVAAPEPPPPQAMDRTPPKPAAKPKPPPAPGAPPSSGGLDDLFGGGGPQEGRVRIGKRTVKKDEPDSE